MSRIENLSNPFKPSSQKSSKSLNTDSCHRSVVLVHVPVQAGQVHDGGGSQVPGLAG